MMNLLRQQQAREAEIAARLREETQKGIVRSEDCHLNDNDNLREIMRAKLAS